MQQITDVCNMEVLLYSVFSDPFSSLVYLPSREESEQMEDPALVFQLTQNINVAVPDVQIQDTLQKKLDLRSLQIKNDLTLQTLGMKYSGKKVKLFKSGNVIKVKINKHPTLLFFLYFIRKELKNDRILNIFQVIARIKRKKCIDLRDYQDFLNSKEFKAILAKSYQEKMILRSLMRSRISYFPKNQYFKITHVFQEAFKKQLFKKIIY